MLGNRLARIWTLLSATRFIQPECSLGRARVHGNSPLFRVAGLALLRPEDRVEAMTLEQANKLVKSCAEQMQARYGKVVFNEWAIISLAEKKGHILAYVGPRREGFAKNFLEDAGSLRSGLLTTEHEVGDYDFARHGVGTGFEAFMVL